MNFEDIPKHELKQAIALKYNGEDAPILIAKGTHTLADEIVGLAEEHGIPLCDNPALVDLLSRVELGEEIPKALYTAVAYILAFAYEMTYIAEHPNEEPR